MNELEAIEGGLEKDIARLAEEIGTLEEWVGERLGRKLQLEYVKNTRRPLELLRRSPRLNKKESSELGEIENREALLLQKKDEAERIKGQLMDIARARKLVEECLNKIELLSFGAAKEEVDVESEERVEQRGEVVRKRMMKEQYRDVWDRSKVDLSHGFFLIPKNEAYSLQVQEALNRKPHLKRKVLVYDSDVHFSANTVFQDLARSREGIRFIEDLLRGKRSEIKIDGLEQLF